MRASTLLVGFVLVAACAQSEPQPDASETDSSPFVGAWRLVSWRATGSDGAVRYPYGEQAKGQLVYTASGQMSAQLLRPDVDISSFAEMDGPAALQHLGETAFFGYWGSYVVDEAAGTVTHHLQGSLSPDYVGTAQVRGFRFQDADNLYLTAQLSDASDPGEMNELHWERVR